MTLDEPGEGGLGGYDVEGEEVMREVGTREAGLKKRTEMKAMRLESLDMRLYRGAHREPYTRRRPVSPVFGKSRTASARKIYGRWEAHFGDRRYGNSSRTNRAVHPSFTVRRAALSSSVSAAFLSSRTPRSRVYTPPTRFPDPYFLA